MNRKLLLSILVALATVLVIRFISPELVKFPHLEDKGASWYFWKLPEATLWGTVTAWGGYLLHQVAVIVFIIKGRKKNLKPLFNTQFLLLNLFFVILHIVQTHIFYDGIAQQVPVWSSQYSVILMLSITIILLMPRRGFILGRFKKVDNSVYNFFRKYHGIYISWALVYTFWFHPTEGNVAILLGFFYMFLLFIHMSFIKTRVHSNIKWITVLETFVTIHGVGIALMNSQAIWPMFLTGFLFMFVYTYMYGLGLNRVKRIIIHILYVILVLVLYYFRGFDKLYEVTFIPVTLYGISLLMLLVVKLVKKMIPSR